MSRGLNRGRCVCVDVACDACDSYSSDISMTVSNKRFLMDRAGTWLAACDGSIMSADTARFDMYLSKCYKITWREGRDVRVVVVGAAP